MLMMYIMTKGLQKQQRNTLELVEALEKVEFCPKICEKRGVRVRKVAQSEPQNPDCRYLRVKDGLQKWGSAPYVLEIRVSTFTCHPKTAKVAKNRKDWFSAKGDVSAKESRFSDTHS